MITINTIKVSQPIGDFYMASMSASLIKNIAEVRRRQASNHRILDSILGVQRDLKLKKVSQIRDYSHNPDAVFPTPIIIAVDEDEENNINIEDKGGNLYQFKLNEHIVGEIIDGQHRIEGITASDDTLNFELPVIFMFGLSLENRAYVFTSINSTQTPVSKSLIFDLFGYTKERSPQKTCNFIIKKLNETEGSPLYRSIKMLGNKSSSLEIISQGSFATYLLSLISKDGNKDLIDIKQNKKLIDDDDLSLRNYYLNDDDESIYKIVSNAFTSIKNTFKEEWNNRKFILTKTTGIGGLFKALNEIIREGKGRKDISIEFFNNKFVKFKHQLQTENVKLTSDFFSSNEAGQNKLKNYIIESIYQK